VQGGGRISASTHLLVRASHGLSLLGAPCRCEHSTIRSARSGRNVRHYQVSLDVGAGGDASLATMGPPALAPRGVVARTGDGAWSVYCRAATAGTVAV